MVTNYIHSGKTVTFGEVLLRLSPPNHEKMEQASSMDFYFGGTEMNVAASLSRFGLKVQHISSVPDNFVGEAAVSTLKRYGIDTSAINIVNHPLGIYFLETGTAMRPSRIAYNRLHGAFAHITPDMVDWKGIFNKCEFFHWTGISAALSEGAYQTLKAGLTEAASRGITITADPTYRSNLWNYGRNGYDVLREFVSLSTIYIGGVDEINEILGSNYNGEKAGFVSACKALQASFPNITKVFDKVRNGVSASQYTIRGRGLTDSGYFETREIGIAEVVDRIGTGDAFAAGLIYALHYYEDEHALNFATAACALKHTIRGDVNLASVADIVEVVQGGSGGRIKR